MKEVHNQTNYLNFPILYFQNYYSLTSSKYVLRGGVTQGWVFMPQNFIKSFVYHFP